jgi:hypothetical protein
VHQPLNGAAGDAHAVASQLPPHLARPVDLFVLVPDPLNRRTQVVIALPPG